MNDEDKKKQKSLAKERYILLAREKQIKDALYKANEMIASLRREVNALKEENALLKSNPDWSQALKDERFVEEYALRDEELKNRIIAEYLRALTAVKNTPVLRGGVGSTPLTPPKKPRSLAEAKKMAEILIKG